MGDIGSCSEFWVGERSLEAESFWFQGFLRRDWPSVGEVDRERGDQVGAVACVVVDQRAGSAAAGAEAPARSGRGTRPIISQYGGQRQVAQAPLVVLRYQIGGYGRVQNSRQAIGSSGR